MKNYIKSITLTLLIGIGLIVQSCDNNEPGLANVKLEMKATTTLSSLNPSGRVMETGLVFTEIILGVTEIEFETLEENNSEDNGDFEDEDGDGEDDNEEIEFEGNFVVDLITGTSTPDFGAADITPGLYEEIEIEMGPILDGGLTMFVAFQYTPDGGTESVSYEFSTTEEIEFELENESGFFLDENALNQMLIVIDLDVIFANVDLSNATADSDRIVRINNSSNSQLYGQIFQSLNDAMEGGEDDDHDGEIDGD